MDVKYFAGPPTPITPSAAISFWAAYLFIALCVVVRFAIGARAEGWERSWEKDRRHILPVLVGLGIFFVIGLIVTWKALKT